MTTPTATAGLLAGALYCVAITAAIAAPTQFEKKTATASRYAVTSGHPEATAAGMQVLRAGGNVVDAAVATSLALGVAEPYGSGIGGKGMLLYRDGKTGRVFAIEAMCAASNSLDAQKFAKLPSRKRHYGYTSVAVPGLLAALDAAHRRWGSLPWREVVRPAAELAERGVVVTEGMYKLMRPKRNLLRRDSEAANAYLVEGETPTVGTTMKFPDLADSLRLIANEGASAFYQGKLAERIVTAAQGAEAPMTLDDFRDYEVRWCEPLQIEYERHRIFSAPPPLTGGTTVLATLQAIEGVAALQTTNGRDPRYIDLVGRILVLLYPRISRAIADVPTALHDANTLCSEETAELLRKEAATVVPTHAHVPPWQPSVQVLPAEEQSTSHLIVADRNGNIVCLTQSLSYHFGACVVAPGTGILLNDSMSNFSTGDSAAANYVAPGKRERSTIAPVIVTRDRVPMLALGIPGGQRIPTTTIQLLTDLLHFGKPLEETFARPRFHVRRPIGKDETANMVDLEEDAPKEFDDELIAMGWKPIRHTRDGHYFGGGSAVMYRPDGKLQAVADPRRTNSADGQ